jgi:hypothetical protein
MLVPEPPPKEATTVPLTVTVPPASSSGLLAKFTRSPSRKHRPRPSSDSIDNTAPVPTPKVSYSRPGLSRATTAPDGAAHWTGPKQQPPRVGDARERTTPANGNMDVFGTALADAVRQPSFKVVKKKEETTARKRDDVPELPVLNPLGTHLAQSIATSAQNGMQNNPKALFQHIHDMSSKRIATLDYMRKALVLLVLFEVRWKANFKPDTKVAFSGLTRSNSPSPTSRDFPHIRLQVFE